MPSFEETLARMKGLYTYGKELNESDNMKPYTLEEHKTAANGTTYGIIRECNKYYIKTAKKGLETVAESYDYIGGFCNKANNEYTSYAKAKDALDSKLFSIRESVDGEVNKNTDNFVSTVFMTEGTEKMRDEIARQRQIMHNAAMIMNESCEIGAARKDDVVKFDGANPEAEKGKKGDEGGKKVSADPAYAGSKTSGVKKNVGPFNQKPSKAADQLSENANGYDEDFGTNGLNKGRDPKSIGWDMEGQSKVNEGEENDWGSEGLPATPGVGEACPKCGKNPCICETDDDDADVDTLGGEDLNTDVDTASDVDVDSDADDIDMGIDDSEEGSDLDADLDSDVEGGEDADSLDDDSLESSEDDDLKAQIADLQAQIDALKEKANFFDDDDDVSADEDMEDDGEDEDEFDFESDDEDDLDADLDSDEDEVDLDSDEDDLDVDSDSDAEGFSEDDLDSDLDSDDDDFDSDEDEEGNISECGDFNNDLYESKKVKMNSIIESVVSSILKEDELHVFGKHPGYRKKPMELPSTGEDKNQWGRDWNDESVHNEEPFGEKIGDGSPFNQLVDAVTKDVMNKISSLK
jgi:hypothetical protein